jgi:tRNA nucleotidyltransferase (CCA-adding enzyme)
LNNQHETVIVRFNQMQFEVTSIRGATLEEDLQRRDLTINSLALDGEGKLIDVVNGEKDIHAHVLRSINPHERMAEDPLRMLRVVRFASELGFKVDRELMDTLVRKKYLIKHVAIERISKEWLKLLKGDHRNTAITMLIETGMYKEIPSLLLNKPGLEQLAKTRSLKGESETICWAIFCICLGIKDEKRLKQLLLSKVRLKEVSSRLHYYIFRQEHVWNSLDLYKASLHVAIDVEKIRSLFLEEVKPTQDLKLMWQALPIRNRSELAVTGRDLLRVYKKEQGPWVRQALSLAESLVVTEQCTNEKTAIFDALEKRRGEL